MKERNDLKLWQSLFVPVFLMTVFLLPLIFILIKRYFSTDLIPLSLINGVIMTGGLMLNLFVFTQLNGKIKKGFIYLLILISSAGFSLSAFLFMTISQPLFFLYGLEVIISYISIIFILITSLSLFSSGFLNYQNAIERERAQKMKEKGLREEMERQIYSSRINPHFLFNSLNLMVSLLDDKEKAEDVLIGLSELLRYNLEASKKKFIALDLEIDSIKKYLFIQQERFGSRLEYEIIGQSDWSVPPLLIQPLVENSIKHNLDESKYIKITIEIKEQKDQLNIEISDSMALLKPEMIGRGSGLELTQSRVQLSGGEFKIEEGVILLCLPKKLK